MTLAVSLLNKITTVKNNCQQLFELFNINLIVYFQTDGLIGQYDKKQACNLGFLNYDLRIFLIISAVSFGFSSGKRCEPSIKRNSNGKCLRINERRAIFASTE